MRDRAWFATWVFLVVLNVTNTALSISQGNPAAYLSAFCAGGATVMAVVEWVGLFDG